MSITETAQKIQSSQFAKEAKKWAKTIFQLAILVIVFIAGFKSHLLYEKTTATEQSHAPTYYNIDQNSVSVNEKGELVILNRESGDSYIFERKIGATIFTMYASQKYAEVNSEK
jgi:hypothetical protein